MSRCGRHRQFPSLQTVAVQILILAMCWSLAAPQMLRAQQKAQAPASPEAWDALRTRILELCSRHEELTVLAEVELLATHYPQDAKVQVCLGDALVRQASAVQDPAAGPAARIRARGAYLKAQELGDKSLYVQIMINALPLDGSESKFSGQKGVDDAMKAGEAAFAKNDYDGALRHYSHALEMDSKNYWATLFIGDVYFSRKEMDEAGKWFARAAELDPDEETAFRYWGDALMSQDKTDEARSKYIDAVIAQPYGPRAWSGMQKWSNRTKVALTHPRIESPNATTEEKGKTTITVDASTLGKKDGRDKWLVYEITRTAWRTKQFKEEYPDEKEYRHSLKEEAAALRLVAELVAKDVKDKKIEQLDISLSNLLKLHEAGMIEAYVLLARADQGISRDYAAYRAANRDKLRRYLEEYVAPNKK